MICALFQMQENKRILGSIEEHPQEVNRRSELFMRIDSYNGEMIAQIGLWRIRNP